MPELHDNFVCMSQTRRASQRHSQWLQISGCLKLLPNLGAGPRPSRFQKVKWIWIDGICINQNDSTEKSTQVAMMWRCYKLGNILAFSLHSQLLLKERQGVRLFHWFDCNDAALFNQLQCCLPVPQDYEDRPILALGDSSMALRAVLFLLKGPIYR